MQAGGVIVGLWVVFALSWIAAAFWSRRTEKAANIVSELPNRLLLGLGAVVFLIPAHRYEGPLRVWRLTASEAWLCVLAIAVGFAFCWWARIELGSLWSGYITKKVDHRVIETGPYALVRHPIYSGLLLALIATAVAKGTVPGLAGAALIAFGLWLKARAEEQWLMAELGAAEYEAYRRRVPMLVPWLR